jgi:hypothetical protein
MIEIHLYGRLRRHAPQSRPDRESVVRLAPRPGETVGEALARAGIEPEEIHHLFLNGALLSTRNTMAPWLDYRQPERPAQGLETPVEPGDRLGLFSHDMPLLVI